MIDVDDMVDLEQYHCESEIEVERGIIQNSCAVVENANPLFWDEHVAKTITGGAIAPPSMISVWFRPHPWMPGRTTQAQPLQVHFDLKTCFGLPEAVMAGSQMSFYIPVRIGDRLRTHQVLRFVGEEKETHLGTGRFWKIDVVYHNQGDELVAIETYTGFGYRRPDLTAPVDRLPRGANGTSQEGPPRPNTELLDQARSRHLTLDKVEAGTLLPELHYEVSTTTIILGAIASRDWRPMHHDRDFAVEHSGTRDIFMNTPNQAAWFERYVTDWTGPYGRIAVMSFQMRGSVFPGDSMVLSGVVNEVSLDETGCGWVTVSIRLSVEGEVKTFCECRVALPISCDDNPWARNGPRWIPDRKRVR